MELVRGFIVGLMIGIVILILVLHNFFLDLEICRYKNKELETIKEYYPAIIFNMSLLKNESFYP